MISVRSCLFWLCLMIQSFVCHSRSINLILFTKLAIIAGSITKEILIFSVKIGSIRKTYYMANLIYW